MRALDFRPEAEAEIRDAYHWYEQSRSGLGKAFLDAVEVAIIGIIRTPLAFPRVHKEQRRAFVRGFPYDVYYEVSIALIDVMSVCHSRRHPRHWQRRRRSAGTAR